MADDKVILVDQLVHHFNGRTLFLNFVAFLLTQLCLFSQQIQPTLVLHH
jgi:hypothetical protein